MPLIRQSAGLYVCPIKKHEPVGYAVDGCYGLGRGYTVEAQLEHHEHRHEVHTVPLTATVHCEWHTDRWPWST